MRVPFEYAVIRVMPRVERGELINVGVILYCQQRDYLAALVRFDPDRLRVLDPAADLDGLAVALRAWESVCDGGEAAGPAGARMTRGERFRWMIAPRSTIIQASAVHMGLTEDPAAEHERLLGRLVG